MYIGKDAQESITIEDCLNAYENGVAVVCEDGRPSYQVNEFNFQITE